MCFSLGAIEMLLIWLVIVCAVIAVIKLLLIPLVLSPMGAPGNIIIQIVNIIVWVVVAIFCIYIIFDLLACLLSGGIGVSHLR